MPFLTPRDARGDPAVSAVEVQRLGTSVVLREASNSDCERILTLPV